MENGIGGRERSLLSTVEEMLLTPGSMLTIRGLSPSILAHVLRTIGNAGAQTSHRATITFSYLQQVNMKGDRQRGGRGGDGGKGAGSWKRKKATPENINKALLMT